MKTFSFSLAVTAFLFVNILQLSAQWTNPMENVGIEHNRLVKSIFPTPFNTAETSSEAISIINESILEDSPDLHWITNRKWSNILEEINYLTENNYISSNIKMLVIETINHVTNEKLNLDEIKSYVNERGNSVLGELNEVEKTQYYSFLSGLKHSAKLWLPQNLGGENLIDTFSPSGGAQVEERHFDPWKAMGCDAVGCCLGPQAGGAATLCSVINQWEW